MDVRVFRRVLLGLTVFSFCCWVFTSSHLMAQKRYLIPMGLEKSKPIPLKEEEEAIEVIKRLERDSAPVVTVRSSGRLSKRGPGEVAGVIDSIGWWDDSQFNVNFGFEPQDVAGYVFWTNAGGIIKEFVFRTGWDTGDIGKATLRVWNSNYGPENDESLYDGGESDSLGWMGYYPHVGDGYGEVTPFPEDATGPFVGNTSSIGFDPLGDEIWRPGGLQMDLVSNAWNRVILTDYLPEPTFSPDEPFIFTLQDDSPGPVGRLELSSFQLRVSDKKHGIKFYEVPRLTSPWTSGWWVRSYMWGSYIVVEITTDRAPVIQSFTQLMTTVSTDPRTVEATITDDNPSGGAAGVQSASLWYSFKGGADVEVVMTGTEPNYTAEIPGGTPADRIAYYVTATDVNGNITTSSSVTYKIFRKSPDALFLLVLNPLSPTRSYPWVCCWDPPPACNTTCYTTSGHLVP